MIGTTMGVVQAVSPIEIDGWTFDLHLNDNWRYGGPDAAVTAYDSDESWPVIHPRWQGYTSTPWYEPNDQTATKYSEGNLYGQVIIYILKIPNSLQGIGDSNIRKKALDNIGYSDSSGSLKDITLDNRKMLLYEWEFGLSREETSRLGSVVTLLDNDNVAIIYVTTYPGANYRPWDVLKELTVTQEKG